MGGVEGRDGMGGHPSLSVKMVVMEPPEECKQPLNMILKISKGYTSLIIRLKIEETRS